MDAKTLNAARERIATAVLAAMIAGKDEFGAGSDGEILATIACDYADALLRQLQMRED